MGKYGFRDNGIKVEQIEIAGATFGAIGTVAVEGTVAKVVEVVDANGSTFYMPLNRAA